MSRKRSAIQACGCAYGEESSPQAASGNAKHTVLLLRRLGLRSGLLRLDAEAPRFRRGTLSFASAPRRRQTRFRFATASVSPVKTFGMKSGHGESTLAKRIKVEVEAGHCACAVKNPSGKCCLGEVTQAARVKLSQKGECKS